MPQVFDFRWSFDRSPYDYNLIKFSSILLCIILSLYYTYLYDTLITYLHRYQNMLWCNIPSWDRADFSALAYIILRDKPATTEAKINNRCGKKKLLSSAFNLQIFENGISDDSDLWNFHFRSSPDFYNFSRWLNLKTGMCSVSEKEIDKNWCQ